jgi:hypothetical protein
VVKQRHELGPPMTLGNTSAGRASFDRLLPQRHVSASGTHLIEFSRRQPRFPNNHLTQHQLNFRNLHEYRFTLGQHLGTVTATNEQAAVAAAAMQFNIARAAQQDYGDAA